MFVCLLRVVCSESQSTTHEEEEAPCVRDHRRSNSLPPPTQISTTRGLDLVGSSLEDTPPRLALYLPTRYEDRCTARIALRNRWVSMPAPVVSYEVALWLELMVLLLFWLSSRSADLLTSSFGVCCCRHTTAVAVVLPPILDDGRCHRGYKADQVDYQRTHMKHRLYVVTAIWSIL